MMNDKHSKMRKILKVISFILLFVVIMWLILVLFEMNRVKLEKKPIICVNEVKDIEDDDEYSITCYGILYKYREYYYKELDELSAREFTLLFKEFDREISETK